MNWKHLTGQDQLAGLLETSKSKPVIIFKHSTRCAISAMALNRLERSWDETSLPDVDIFFLDLIQHRDVSNAIADLLGVYHQSPQIIILQGGKAIYDDSHTSISFAQIQQVLSKAA